MKHLSNKKEHDAFLEENKGKLIVLDFYAQWCPPCRILGPKFEALPGQFKTCAFAKVDVDQAEDICKVYEIKCMPTLIYQKDEKILHRIEGCDEDAMVKSVEEFK
ncbi:unnamed protein product [Calicophoron daubneyi]|uniref:Thioredoxin domain-containing protein n=1 Tax=Calicophoron daubneyi TaxID=300641 RepID=A0AAV2TLI2_CALDB